MGSVRCAAANTDWDPFAYVGDAQVMAHHWYTDQEKSLEVPIAVAQAAEACCCLWGQRSNGSQHAVDGPNTRTSYSRAVSGYDVEVSGYKNKGSNCNVRMAVQHVLVSWLVACFAWRVFLRCLNQAMVVNGLEIPEKEWMGAHRGFRSLPPA